MMNANKILAGALLLSAGLGAAIAAPKHAAPPVSADGDVVVGLCDGETVKEIDGLKDGETLSREEAQALSDELMAEWTKKNPGAVWVAMGSKPKTDDAKEGEKPAAPAKKSEADSPGSPKVIDASDKVASDPLMRRGLESAASGALQLDDTKGAVQTGHTYGNFSERDVRTWALSTQAFVEDGNRIFHDAKELGGTIGISCDMCHPDGANTHPETYPKYQVQLGRVALLRDMVNWCIENPVRGKPLADGDPKMKAIEAYLYAQRKGTPLQFGKH